MKKPEHDDYQPIPPRRRWLILLLGVGTALLIAWMLLERPGGVHGPKYRATVPNCVTPLDSGCIGGKADVIMPSAPPGAPSASAATR